MYKASAHEHHLPSGMTRTILSVRPALGGGFERLQILPLVVCQSHEPIQGRTASTERTQKQVKAVLYHVFQQI